MITLDDVILPDDIIWIDEFKWDKNKISKEYSVTGSLVIQTGSKKKGRIITLQGDENTAWITRQTLMQLQIKSEVVGGQWTLTWIDDRVFNVMINSIEAEPLFHVIKPNNEHYYKVAINLIEV